MKDRIKKIRKCQKETQQVFATRLNVSKSTIEAMEYGRREATDRVISDICRVYGVNEEWLRFGTGEMYAPREREDEIAEIASELLDEVDPSIKKELVKIIMHASEAELEAILDVAKQLVEAMEK